MNISFPIETQNSFQQYCKPQHEKVKALQKVKP